MSTMSDEWMRICISRIENKTILLLFDEQTNGQRALKSCDWREDVWGVGRHKIGKNNIYFVRSMNKFMVDV